MNKYKRFGLRVASVFWRSQRSVMNCVKFTFLLLQLSYNMMSLVETGLFRLFTLVTFFCTQIAEATFSVVVVVFEHIHTVVR